ncbi:MAG: Asp23/Gls24 family envelope stress response protein [Candidatus Firestonebacteria bacterium]
MIMKNNDTSANTLGIVRISDDAIASIAAISAKKINGVFGLHQGLAVRFSEALGFSKNGPGAGVRVEIGDKEVWIEMVVNVKFGFDVPAIIAKVQESVRDNVEAMTGLAVREINVNIKEIVE